MTMPTCSLFCMWPLWEMLCEKEKKLYSDFKNHILKKGVQKLISNFNATIMAKGQQQSVIIKGMEITFQEQQLALKSQYEKASYLVA